MGIIPLWVKKLRIKAIIARGIMSLLTLSKTDSFSPSFLVDSQVCLPVFAPAFSDFPIISRDSLHRAMVNFSPLVGWSHSISMFHADLFHDPGQHPTSRLYLLNNLFALCILVWVTDIYFYFDIWTTEPTSGILAGTHARPILAVSL